MYIELNKVKVRIHQLELDIEMLQRQITNLYQFIGSTINIEDIEPEMTLDREKELFQQMNSFKGDATT